MSHRKPIHTSAQREYEKFRKRSWRKETMNGMVSIYDLHFGYLRHEAYLQGLRDGLEARNGR